MKDLLMVDAVDEAHVVDELVTRYRQGYVYTFLGPVLIAMNPYKLLRQPNGDSIYARNMIDEFQGKELHLCEPHPFALAENAYTSLMRFGLDQSLLITGESGSGKTETSKHVMRYLTTISTRSRAKSAVIANRRMSVAQRKEADDMTSHVTDVLWGSNPVLEAFGNAQTIRNNNSSRFGKYIVLQMNRVGQVIGGYIDNYLLERSRVIRQAEGERNFHAFYQLMAGATAAEREAWQLPESPEEFDILANEDSTIEGVDDTENYRNVRQNMTAVGITDEEQLAIFQQLAAILWLGNVHFKETTDEAHNPRAAIEAPEAREALEKAASLLGIDKDKLESLMTFRIVNIYREDQKVLFDARQAKKVVDSIMRSLYEKIFDWIVARINKNVTCKKRDISNSIGILDIYGFEIFDVNAFEQLCINYVNEKLQQLFISQTLESEQEGYRREGLSWQNIKFFNNQCVCDLIEDPKQHGIFPLLDEQCAIARLSDLELIERYNSEHSRNPHYVASRVRGPNFGIVHYAGKVEYDVTLFFDANVDTFFNDLQDGMEHSSNAFVREVFLDKRTKKQTLKRPPSTSQQFRTQVADLLQKLDGCNPHYIRCIKPNEKKSPLAVNKELVAEQVRYLGLVENLSVRRQGFCYSQPYGAFIKRYSFLSKSTWPAPVAHSSRKAAIDLLTTAGLGVRDPDNKDVLVPFEEDSKTLGCFSLGRNKIFLRHPQALSALEILREERIPAIVNIIENAWRRYKNRLALNVFQAASTQLFSAYDAVWKNCQDRRKRVPGAGSKAQIAKMYATWEAVSAKLLDVNNSRLVKNLKKEEELNSVLFMQSFVHARTQRREFLKLKQAQIVFSKRYRGVKTRKELANDMWRSCKVALLGVRTEFERYMGKKKRRRDSLDRTYQGDYIGVNKYPAYASIIQAHSEGRGSKAGSGRGKKEKLLFLGTVEKVNERFAHQTRVLMISENRVFNLKADKIQQPKERRVFELARLTGVAMSTQPDNYLILRVKGEIDLMVQVTQKTEVVQALRSRIQKGFGRELPVEFSDELDFYAAKGKQLKVKFAFDRSMKDSEWSKVDRHTMQIKVGII
jgi:myosin-1